MISEQAKYSFDFIFKKSVYANFPTSDDDVYEITSIQNEEDIVASELSIITIASPSFRFFVIFHFNSQSDILKNSFSKNTDSENKENDSFLDAFLEFCNMCCGSISRELYPHCDFLGMSTPYVLLNKSSAFIDDLHPNYIARYKITINDTAALYGTICVCDYGVVDFKVDTTIVEEDAGELELF